MTNNWDLFDTRHVTFKPKGMSEEELKEGYDWSYKTFYTWPSIVRSSLFHGSIKHQAKHFFYTSGWKKFEAVWKILIEMKQLDQATPLLEAILSKITRKNKSKKDIASNTLAI